MLDIFPLKGGVYVPLGWDCFDQWNTAEMKLVACKAESQETMLLGTLALESLSYQGRNVTTLRP